MATKPIHSKAYIHILCLLILSCGGGTIQPIKYYEPVPPILERIGGAEGPYFPIMVAIKPFSSTKALESTRIVYRPNEYEYRYYPFRRWVARPGRLSAMLLLDFLKKRRIFLDVAEFSQSIEHHLVLGGYVHYLEEVDTPEGWIAHLGIDFKLSRTVSEAPIWSLSFDSTYPIEKKEVKYVVKALSILIGQAFTELENGLITFLSSHPDAYRKPSQ